MKNFKRLLYKSNRGEIKTLKQWIEFANRNDAIFACSSDEDKIKIVTKDYFNEKVLRELIEHKFFKEKYEYQKNRFQRTKQPKMHRAGMPQAIENELNLSSSGRGILLPALGAEQVA